MLITVMVKAWLSSKPTACLHGVLDPFDLEHAGSPNQNGSDDPPATVARMKSTSNEVQMPVTMAGDDRDADDTSATDFVVVVDRRFGARCALSDHVVSSL
jgi:hypothetical protein